MTVHIPFNDRCSIVEQLAAKLETHYVDVAIGARVAQRLLEDRARWSTSERSLHAWAQALNHWMRAETDDDHLRLTVHEPRPTDNLPHNAIDEAEPPRGYAATNFGFERVEVLSENVGHMVVRQLLPPAMAKPTLEAAFAFVTHTRALVLDLRGNRGGDSEMVSMLMGIFLGQAVPLCSLHERRGDRVHPCYASPQPIHYRRTVVALVDATTASAAEWLAYDLKRLARARVVGAPTRGAAHAVESYRLHPRVRVAMPYGRALDPNHRNWHRTGVPLDVQCSSDKAWDRALDLINAADED